MILDDVKKTGDESKESFTDVIKYKLRELSVDVENKEQIN